jgi:hypothetical protein
MTQWCMSFNPGRRPQLPAGDRLRPAGAAVRHAVLPAALAVVLLASLAGRASAVCVGDCDEDGRVSIANVQACVNRGAGLQGPACAAADQNLDGSVDANEVDQCIQAFLDASTCPLVFTPVPTPTRTNTPGPTATITNTALPTATQPVPTATLTPTIAEFNCDLAATSGIQLFIAALPVPLAFPITGSIGIGAGPPDGSGNSTAVCDVKQLNPVNIPSIGVVCISQGGGCAVGRRDCDGGTPLGIEVASDGNAGACTGNAVCQTICATHCGDATHVLSAQCTGYCTAGDQSACTSDAQCEVAPKGGACNGPDNLPAARANLCQCNCLDTAAHGPGVAGDLQCNLGSSLLVENAAPCGGNCDGPGTETCPHGMNSECPAGEKCITDVKISVGSTCIPVTTERASSLISNANFAAGSTVPGEGNSNDIAGATVSCAAFDAGMLSGVTGVGAVNFFGSALGDLAVGLRATCK